MRRIIAAVLSVVVLSGAIAVYTTCKPAPGDPRKGWTATFTRHTMSNEIGMGPENDGYILAVRSNGDTSRIETQLGVQLAPFVATPAEIYSFIPELKLKMTFYRAPQPTPKTDPTCETRPGEFNPGKILGRAVFHGLPVVKWQKRTPLSAGQELIVEAWEAPECGCVAVYRTAVALTSDLTIDAVTTEILSDLKRGEPDPSLFNASGFREVTPSEFHRRFQELKGLSHPLYDKSVLERWDARQRDSLRYKYD